MLSGFSRSSGPLQTAVFLLAYLISNVRPIASTCYWPDGSVVAEDIPCNSNSSTSACCPEDAYCLSNGLCFGNLHLGRRSCTDPTWKAAECTNLCIDVNPSGGKAFGICSPDLYSCDYQTCASQNFSITNSRNTQIVLRDSQLVSLGLQSTAPAATPAATPAPASSTAPASSRATSAVVLPNTSSAPYSSSAKDSNDHTAVAVGVGVGVPLGLCAFGGLVLLLLARRKIKRLTSEKDKAEAELRALVNARGLQEKAYGAGVYEVPSNAMQRQELSAGDGNGYGYRYQLHA